jgi:hypothetical protein
MTSVGDEAVAGRYEATLAAAKVAIQAAAPAPCWPPVAS